MTPIAFCDFSSCLMAFGIKKGSTSECKLWLDLHFTSSFSSSKPASNFYTFYWHYECLIFEMPARYYAFALSPTTFLCKEWCLSIVVWFQVTVFGFTNAEVISIVQILLIGLFRSFSGPNYGTNITKFMAATVMERGQRALWECSTNPLISYTSVSDAADIYPNNYKRVKKEPKPTFLPSSEAISLNKDMEI